MYKLSLKAVQDFSDIYQYTLNNFGEQQAEQYTFEMESCLSSLGFSPYLGRDCSHLKAGIRRFDISKHAIFYRIRLTHIFVIRILHHQMDSRSHL
ncbi:type II toxin-antitoxin system RelE/ParE family toxin [Vibrio algarum]|uniref:Toxin n=1 Tax=Vibrio algarum TaxID=3020714 RepID=A0ABT4YLI1_9VIBR|nr:type II toxin-antitoxin system RelE/ParE family toxin [Vibrio sp. KJ40-1]MDB1122397.1 type II toxin-antitoxin system RelE/ParE family toxin [Vibrio sp. KJ40-1]